MDNLSLGAVLGARLQWWQSLSAYIHGFSDGSLSLLTSTALVMAVSAYIQGLPSNSETAMKCLITSVINVTGRNWGDLKAIVR